MSAIEMSLHGWAIGDNLAGLVASLLSAEAAMITGISVSIDGGYRSR
jgi:hypothetical protein